MRLLTTCLLMCLSCNAYSADDQLNTRSQAEIQHLLEFVATSPCKLIRNGRGHTQEEAKEHIQKKFDHYRDQISNAEDFIELSASKSTLSGRPYLIQCLDRPVTLSRNWLLNALKQYRDTNP